MWLGERLTLQTPDLEVWGSSLACRVFSLDKELHSTLSLFTQLFKWVCDGLESHPGGSSNTPRHAPCWGNRDRLRPFGPLARRVRLCSFNFKVAWVAGVERAEARGTERKGKEIGERRKEAPSSQVLFLPHFSPTVPSPLLRLSHWFWNAVRREWDCWVDGGLRSLNRSFRWRLVSPIYWHLHLLLYSIK